MRETTAGSRNALPVRRENQGLEAKLGRYLHMQAEDVGYRVYFEEAGQGIPLVCQHTAGSHGVQFLTDPDITSRFRVIVPDLPYHGKSFPPESQECGRRNTG